MESSALISYKGENWDAYVKMVQGQQLQPEQQFYFNREGQQPQQQPKAHFWNRPKLEKSEFKSE
jgi:hypothetical protein